jgi:hypothetical protein
MEEKVEEERMTNDSIQEAHEAFGKQVSSQVARITGELNRLDGLLKAGRVDARVLSEFRLAVDRVRTSGWQVQVWLAGDPRTLSLLLMEERIRLTNQIVQQLTTEIVMNGTEFLGLGLLKESIQKLERLL